MVKASTIGVYLEGPWPQQIACSSLAGTWLACVDCLSVVSNIACVKRFSTNNPSIIEVSGSLDSYLVLAADAAFEDSHHLLSTCHHHLTLEP